MRVLFLVKRKIHAKMTENYFVTIFSPERQGLICLKILLEKYIPDLSFIFIRRYLKNRSSQILF